MANQSADVVICGAGIAGVSAAYHLSVRRGIRNIVLVDAGPPLSMTSDKSLECYRNWHPGPGSEMVQLVNRSIDIMEELERETTGRFNMNRRGYAFATTRESEAQRLLAEALEEQRLGAGPLRVHHGQPGDPSYQPAPAQGFEGQPTGSDLLLDKTLIGEYFPYLSPDTVAVLHARRCGWFSAQQYGMYLLEQAREHGVQLLHGTVEDVLLTGGRVTGVKIATQAGPVRVATPCFVSAAGPLQKSVGSLLDIDLPITCELHAKAAFADPLGVLPRTAPMLIWMDSGPLRWTEEERTALADDADTHYLLESFPAGVHGRPEGQGNVIILQWSIDLGGVEPSFPVAIEPDYAEKLLRAMAVAIPGLEAYFGHARKPFVDGGYYAKTPENRPLAGPLPVPGAYIIGGLSGFGMQSASALGELVSLHIAGAALPVYAPAFALHRYDDPGYQRALEDLDPGLGQI